MYEAHFGISGPPFQLSPDPTFYYDSKGHHEALAVLRRGLSEQRGLVVVSGDIGAGKTTLVRTLLGEVDPATLAVAQVLSTQLDDLELLRAILLAFGAPADQNDADVMRRALQAYLMGLAREGRRAILIVDEAQNLHRSALEMLAQLEAGAVPGGLPIKVCLIGQPELRDIVASADMLMLRERVNASCHLSPLALEETGAYIRHRLAKVGWSGKPSFEAGSLEEIHRWTDGIPRRINLLCNRLMLSRFLSETTSIEPAAVAQIAKDLRAEIGDVSPLPAPVRAVQAAAPTVEAEVLPDSVSSLAQAPEIRLRDPSPLPVAPAPVPAAEGQKHAGSPGVDLELEVNVDVNVESPGDAQHPALPALRNGDESRPLLCVVGGQGEHVKAAALMHAMAARPELPVTLLVRCYANSAFERHHDMFAGLDVGGRVVNLGVAGGTYAGRAAELMKRFEFVVDHCQPAAVIVFDGSDAALSCGLVASRKGLPVLHVGAGLRSGTSADAADITRRLADQLSDVLYTTEPQANQQLAQEGVGAERVRWVGNTLADALQIALRSRLATPNPRERLGLPVNLLNDRNGYGVVVLDAMANVGDRQVLAELINILRAVAHDVPLVWPMHTRTRELLAKHKLDAVVASERIATLPSQSYPSLVQLMSNATCVITDSWNVQEETTILSVPCLTIGVGPERAITASVGSNLVVGSNKALATRAVWDCIFNGGKRGRAPDLWDGKAAERIAEHMVTLLGSRRAAGVKVAA